MSKQLPTQGTLNATELAADEREAGGLLGGTAKNSGKDKS